MPRQLSFEQVLTPNGLERHRRLLIDDAGRIVAMEADLQGPWDGALALPGMPNAHSHAFQRALVGVRETAATDSFWTWRDAMYRVASALDAEDLYVIARRAYLEMMQAGFTTVGEFHYLHHRRDGSRSAEMADAVRRAARDAGIRLTLLPVFYQLGGFGQPALIKQRRFVHDSLEDFGRLLEQVKDADCGVAPHSLRAVTLKSLPELVALADQVLGPDCPIHIHVSEQAREVSECVAAHGRPPIQCLDETVQLGARWSLVHATHAEPHELAILRKRQPNLVLCPLTEAYLGDGVFPLAAFCAQGGVFAIGSDSNARLDAVEELRLAEYGQRLALERRSVLSGADGLGQKLWSEAAAAGARSLRQSVGAIAPGAFADLVVLDLEDPLFAGLSPERCLDAWLIGGSSAQIATVYAGGERRVDHGVSHLPEALDQFVAVMRRFHDQS